MSTVYRYAPEVESIARELISEHHRHLVNCNIRYLFTDKTQKRAGKEVWGTARKISSMSAFLAGEDDPEGNNAFFVMTVSEPVWSFLSPERRRALVDHELCHMYVDIDDNGAAKLILLGHDLEEFVQVIQRHGLWRDDVTKFVEVGSQCLQATLFEAADAPETSGDRNARNGPIGRVDLTFANSPR